MKHGQLRHRERTASVQIDGDALRHNLDKVREYAPDSKVMAVIKANAYGHNVLIAAEHLDQADAFAVAMPAEAVTLRRAGISRPLVVLQGFSSLTELELCATHDLQPVVHHQWQAELLHNATRLSVDVWLKIDTGMHRLGVPLVDVDLIYRMLKSSAVVGSIRFMSHFANADDPSHQLNNNQLESLINVTSNYDAERSMANSAAIVSLADSHLEWVRPGIMLYGTSPLLERSAADLGLKPVMQFESQLIALQQLRKGDAIGYGSTWQCPEDMPVGVVAAGYGDGYPRHAPSGTPVWINGHQCPTVGRVSMDSVCVDLRGVDARYGDRVVLWGRELCVDTIAGHAGTISYEILCHAGNSAYPGQ
ncbi:MAG: alanine racemase [Thiotrichales bacterium]|nr:MAG: alanine racemase [Thiotrichales bacterium]